MERIVLKIKKELESQIDKKHRESSARWYKPEEENLTLGVKTPIVRAISKKYFQEIRSKSKQEIFKLAEKLCNLRYNEYKTVGFDWAYRIKKQFDEKDLKTFENWVREYVVSWSTCDDLCSHAVGYYFYAYPLALPVLKTWAEHNSIWFRRAAAVSLLYSLRKDKCLDNAFEIAKILLEDKEDLVQKAYGWMLKEAANKHQKEVFDFVMKHKKKMPRTALRYAVEKMPKSMKKRAYK